MVKMSYAYNMKKTTTSPQNTTSKDELIKELVTRNESLEKLVSWYENQFRLYNAQKYGRSSETMSSPDQLELPLFNEAEITSTLPEHQEEPLEKQESALLEKAARVRSTEMDYLPKETKYYSLPHEEQACSSCGYELHVMKTETHRTIEIIPASVKIIEHEQEVYACRNCEKEAIKTPIVKAPMPKAVFPKSMASPSAVAYVLTQKYQLGLPLYRQEQSFRQLKLPVSRQTMSNWTIYAAQTWLSLLVNRMKKEMLKEVVLHADETTVQVLREEGRDASSKSYMWLYRTGKESFPCVVYEYQTTRAAKHPQHFLKGFKGTIHVDGYIGYKSLSEIRLSGCWAHARRKFVDAQKAAPPSKGGLLTTAEQAIQKINQFYKIEEKIRDLSVEERQEIRLQQSLPLVEAYFVWLQKMKKEVLPKSKLGEAIGYSLNQRIPLLVPFSTGNLEIDNNRAERSIKPFTIGRKNWLFSNSSKGADSSALIYSVIETAKENQLNVFEYLVHLFQTLPNIDLEEIDCHLPWSNTLPTKCYLDRHD